MLPDIPANDELYVGPDMAPLSPPPSSERRDSGIGEVGIDSLDNILGPAEAELPRLEIEDDAGYTLLLCFTPQMLRFLVASSTSLLCLLRVRAMQQIPSGS